MSCWNPGIANFSISCEVQSYQTLAYKIPAHFEALYRHRRYGILILTSVLMQSRQETAKPAYNYVIRRFCLQWSEMGDSNSRHLAPKPMSKPSGRTVSHSLALSGTPAVPLWNSIGLFISATAFGFWDLCGIEFCILKVLPTGFTSNSGCFLPQRAAQKLRRINKEISAGVILPTLSINGKCVVVAKTPSENVQTKKKLAHFL